MYRTYRNLYRIRPSISSIGQGRQRIRLPRGMSITIDVAILTFLFWIPSSLLFGFLLNQVIPLPPFLIGFAVSSLISYQLGKMDPAGKTILVYLRDYFTYLSQSKVHDGFEKRPKINRKRSRVFWKVPLTLIEDGRVASLPAKGKASQFELCVPASVKVKHGEVTFHHRGKRIEPGYYEVNGNQLDKKQKPPSLKRVRPMIPNKQG